MYFKIILLCIILRLASSASSPVTWLSSNYFKSANKVVSLTATSGPTTEYFSVTYGTPMTNTTLKMIVLSIVNINMDFPTSKFYF